MDKLSKFLFDFSLIILVAYVSTVNWLRENKSLGLHPFLFEFPAGKNACDALFPLCNGYYDSVLGCMEKRRGQKPVFARWPSLPLLGSRAKAFKCPSCCFTTVIVHLGEAFFQRQITGLLDWYDSFL